MPIDKTPRGIRNNNPGNIDYSPKVKWQNLDEPPSDGRFCRFKTPSDGIRALARVLITYQDKRQAADGSKIDTVREIVERWAPPVENDTSAYVAAVRRALGLTGPEVEGEVDVHDYHCIKPLVKAIIRHENGQQPYTDAQIDKGLLMAGVKPPEAETLQGARTIQGAQAAAAGTAGTATVGLTAIGELSDQLRDTADTISPLVYYGKWIMVAFVVLTMGGIGLAAYARWDQRRKGIN